MELLVANQIVDLDLPIRLVYEQVWWPHICREKNPELYEVPPIKDAAPSDLSPMVVVYRLAGIDGEATEDRVESLQDEQATEKDLEKRFAITKVLCQSFTEEEGPNALCGIQVLLECLRKTKSMEKERYFVE